MLMLVTFNFSEKKKFWSHGKNVVPWGKYAPTEKKCSLGIFLHVHGIQPWVNMHPRPVLYTIPRGKNFPPRGSTFSPWTTFSPWELILPMGAFFLNFRRT